MTGLRSNEQAGAVLSQLAPANRLSLPEDGWAKAWDLAARLRKKGITVSAADCLIATVATIHAATLIHCDSNFELIAEQSGMKTIDWTRLL
jgi:predicted nucleic acid-binding protein